MLTMLDLFSGIGGFSLAAEWTGRIRTVAFCEIEPFCQKVLKKHWPDVSIFSDIKELRWWTERGILCEQKRKEQPIIETLKKPKQQNWQGELFENVNVAESLFPCPQALPTGDGDFAPGNADKSQCAGIMPQMPTVGSGCKAKITPTGRMEPAINAAENIKHSLKRCNGEEGYSQEINTPVNNADIQVGESSMPTILKHGKIIPKNDSISKTELPSVPPVIEKYTQRREQIDILTAGVPCQPASCAGKQRGTEDDRWLWGEVLRIVREAHPTWCIFENVGGLLTLEGGLVFENLLSQVEAEGYEVQPLIIPACAVNAPHRRDRVWIVAYSQGRDDRRIPGKIQGENEQEKTERPQKRGAELSGTSKAAAHAYRDSSRPRRTEPAGQQRAARTANDVADSHSEGLSPQRLEGGLRETQGETRSSPQRRSMLDEVWGTKGRSAQSRLGRMVNGLPAGVHGYFDREPDIPRVATGIKNRVDRIKALGNSIVPQVAYPILQAIAEIEVAGR